MSRSTGVRDSREAVRSASDTPGHIGRGGGITLHPHVALGDPVHRRIGDEGKAIGVVTNATWDRLEGSLMAEFLPREEHRIAVGDDVWVDLNPAPRTKEAENAGGPLDASTSRRNSR